jgi:hypothetical protein
MRPTRIARKSLFAFLILYYWVLAAVGSGAAFLAASFGCDEGCYESGDWSTDQEAWQWGFLKLLAFASFVLATAAAVRMARLTSEAARALFFAQVALLIGLGLVLEKSSAVRVSPELAFLVATGLAAGGVAIIFKSAD